MAERAWLTALRAAPGAFEDWAADLGERLATAQAEVDRALDIGNFPAASAARAAQKVLTSLLDMPNMAAREAQQYAEHQRRQRSR